jgi:hypothetical protein
LDTRETNIPNSFYSDRFDVGDTSNLSLFLYNGFLSILAKNDAGAVIGTHLYSFSDEPAFVDILSQDSLINSKNTAGTLHVHNDHFCLVPTVLFDPSEKSTYLNFITELSDQYEIFYEGVDSNNIQVVGAVEKQLLTLLDNALPDLEVTHASCLILSYLTGLRGDLLGQEIFVFAEQGHMYVVAFAGTELKLFNRFPTRGEEDFLKYTFAVIHQLAFDRMYCRITVLGDVSGIQVDLEILRQYFRNIQAVDPQSNQSYSPGAEKFKATHLLEAFWTL